MCLISKYADGLFNVINAYISPSSIRLDHSDFSTPLSPGTCVCAYVAYMHVVISCTISALEALHKGIKFFCTQRIKSVQYRPPCPAWNVRATSFSKANG